MVLEGIVEPTGMSIQARSSYTPHEILWGYRFMNLLNYSRLTSQYRIDYSSFNKVYKVDTPRVSAKQLADDDVDDGQADAEGEEEGERPATVVTVLPSPEGAKPLPRFLQQAQMPYERSFASMVPPFPSVGALTTAMNKRDWVVNSCDLRPAAAQAASRSRLFTPATSGLLAP